MAADYKKTDLSRRPEEERESGESGAGMGKDEACRCKEASEMSPRQLFKLMISDLAFWKKEKKE
jgi:hypothetical protein